MKVPFKDKLFEFKRIFSIAVESTLENTEDTHTQNARKEQ